jgi:hypothetical protein
MFMYMTENLNIVLIYLNMIDIIRLGGNEDPANGYDASDLFYYLLLNARGEDFYNNLNEQLTDMYRLGRCPQGRVIRLMSLVNAFVNTETPPSSSPPSSSPPSSSPPSS